MHHKSALVSVLLSLCRTYQRHSRCVLANFTSVHPFTFSSAIDRRVYVFYRPFGCILRASCSGWCVRLVPSPPPPPSTLRAWCAARQPARSPVLSFACLLAAISLAISLLSLLELLAAFGCSRALLLSPSLYACTSSIYNVTGSVRSVIINNNTHRFGCSILAASQLKCDIV